MGASGARQALASPRGRLRSALMMAAGFAVYALLNAPSWRYVGELFATGANARGALWATLYCVSGAVLLWLFASLRGWGLALAVCVAAVSATTNYVVQSTLGNRLTLEFVGWLLDQAGSLGDAYAEFRSDFLMAVAWVAGLVALLLVWRHEFVGHRPVRRLLDRTGMKAAALAAFLGLHGVWTWMRPDQLPVESNAVLLAALGYASPIPPLPPVTSVPAPRPDLDKIILIVDESVRADVLEEDVGPVLEAFPHVDYLEAAATVNCSAGSNALLRWGLDQRRVGRAGYDPRTIPSIWSYARRAGYRTVLIDGQSKGAMQNWINAAERTLIDEFVPARRGLETDADIARDLRRRLQDRAREFIFVIKRGTHFPYKNDYPTGSLPENAPRQVQYEAAVRYSTAGFFRLLEQADYTRSFVVYTSDHGQRLEPNMPTHCNPSPVWQEYSVPLVIITGVEDIRRRLEAGVASVRGHASHEQIFPTLLDAMGYSHLTEAAYAAPLFQRWDGYSVLLHPFVPVPGRHTAGVTFRRFDHFPYREVHASAP